MYLLAFFSGLAVLLLIGLPVAFAFTLVNMIGVYFLWGGTAGLNQIILSIESSISTFVLVPVPNLRYPVDWAAKQGLWGGVSAPAPLTRLRGQTLGALGLGRIGRAALQRPPGGGTTAAPRSRRSGRPARLRDRAPGRR